jgi:CYTH domain-containing protein
MHRYSRVEYERRFLVNALPAETPWAVRRIRDLYIDGTRIRLRRSEGIVAGRPETIRKLTQKIPFVGALSGCQGELTTFYLDEREYEALSRLPGAIITKTRNSFPPLGVDVFDGPLEGLLIAEMEFEIQSEMARFEPPSWCGREISTESRFSGSALARLAECDARALVSELDIGRRRP